MALCHKCGREIPRKTGVFKVVKTGKYSGGSDYYRNVSLCPQCAEQMETEANSQNSTRIVLIVVGAIVAIGLVYWFFLR